MMQEILPPGADTGDDMLSHEGEECGIVIRGTVEVTVGEQVHQLAAGDGYYFDSRTPHRFRNVGEQECELISANTPASF
jgi:mannose-6-phosphate isomerase-like protein (cupin superfamily)